MSEQRDMFRGPPRKRALLSDQPVSRSVDAITSHLAEAEINASGLRASQQEQMLRLVKEHPCRTSAELAVIGGVDRYVAARRLPELRTSGHIENGETVTCRATGRKAMTWRTKCS